MTIVTAVRRGGFSGPHSRGPRELTDFSRVSRSKPSRALISRLRRLSARPRYRNPAAHSTARIATPIQNATVTPASSDGATWQAGAPWCSSGAHLQNRGGCKAHLGFESPLRSGRAKSRRGRIRVAVSRLTFDPRSDPYRRASRMGVSLSDAPLDDAALVGDAGGRMERESRASDLGGGCDLFAGVVPGQNLKTAGVD